MAKKSLEERMERLEAVHEIQNLMGRYSHFHLAEDQGKTVELWSKRPDCRIEMAWGVYEGSDAAARCYLVDHKTYPVIGSMHCHTLTSPVIEIAGDGETAKGVWISPGVESDASQGKLRADWTWIKYGADFVKEDGKWKFWHLHVYGMFLAPYHQSWIEVPQPPPWPAPPEGRKIDRPPTGQWEYSPIQAPKLVPAPPEPYETFDEKTAY